jgi:hypothetical protein
MSLMLGAGSPDRTGLSVTPIVAGTPS